MFRTRRTFFCIMLCKGQERCKRQCFSDVITLPPHLPLPPRKPTARPSKQPDTGRLTSGSWGARNQLAASEPPVSNCEKRCKFVKGCFVSRSGRRSEGSRGNFLLGSFAGCVDRLHRSYCCWCYCCYCYCCSYPDLHSRCLSIRHDFDPAKPREYVWNALVDLAQGG